MVYILLYIRAFIKDILVVASTIYLVALALTNIGLGETAVYWGAIVIGVGLGYAMIWMPDHVVGSIHKGRKE